MSLARKKHIYSPVKKIWGVSLVLEQKEMVFA